jgi:DNA-binding NarL/FixJ family response regulator
MGNSNTKWTEDEDRTVLALKAAGKSNRAIADALGRSPSAVEQRIYFLRNRCHA